MKKLSIMTMATALMALACVSGCVSAKAFTKVKNPDGTQTESSAAVWGWGDKASQLAAEGLFADGTVEDLGAGFKTTSASQESTGIAQTLTALTQLMQAAAAAKAPVALAAPVAARSISIAPGETCPTCGHCDECAPPTSGR
jgi:hypothetical protein